MILVFKFVICFSNNLDLFFINDVIIKKVTNNVVANNIFCFKHL